jgi:hypothetical protein
MWAIASHLAVAAYFDVAAGAKPTGATEPELLYIYFSVIVLLVVWCFVREFWFVLIVLLNNLILRRRCAAGDSRPPCPHLAQAPRALPVSLSLRRSRALHHAALQREKRRFALCVLLVHSCPCVACLFAGFPLDF